MQPFRAPGEIPACSRCGLRLEPAAVKYDASGLVLCPRCFVTFSSKEQDRKVMALWLPIVFGFSFLIALMIVAALMLFVYRHAGP